LGLSKVDHTVPGGLPFARLRAVRADPDAIPPVGANTTPSPVGSSEEPGAANASSRINEGADLITRKGHFQKRFHETPARGAHNVYTGANSSRRRRCNRAPRCGLLRPGRFQPRPSPGQRRLLVSVHFHASLRWEWMRPRDLPEWQWRRRGRPPGSSLPRRTWWSSTRSFVADGGPRFGR
jgi:hypothetical protein